MPDSRTRRPGFRRFAAAGTSSPLGFLVKCKSPMAVAMGLTQ